MDTEKNKCNFNVFSPSTHCDNYYRNKIVFQNYMTNVVKMTKFMRNCQHPILWCNCNLSFRNFLWKHELRRSKRYTQIRSKNYTQFFLFLRFKRRTFTEKFFINFQQNEILMKIMKNIFWSRSICKIYFEYTSRRDVICKKVSETEEVLRRAIKRCCSITLPPCSQFSLIRDNYFYSVRRYFVILNIAKFFNFVI